MSNIITSINTDVSIKGDGKTLGLISGITTFGLQDDINGIMSISTGTYGSNQGSAIGPAAGPNRTLGVTTDAFKSGIVGMVTRTQINCQYIIKY